MAFEFTKKLQQALSDAIQLAKDYGTQVHPEHIAFVLIDEGSGEPNSGSVPLFASVVQSAGRDPVYLYRITLVLSLTRPRNQMAVNRAIQDLVVKLPTRSPPPDEISFNSAVLKPIREAQSLQMNMRVPYIGQGRLLRTLIKDPSVAAILMDMGKEEGKECRP